MIDEPQSKEFDSEIPPIIDFEASGLDKVASYPISVGIATCRANYYALIRPEQDWTHWCQDAERIHGLSRDHLIAEGLATDAVVDRIERLLPSNRTIYSDNPSWDGFWARRLGVPHLEICNVKELVPLGTRRELKRLAAQIRLFSHICHHNAIDDAVALRLAITHLRKEAQAFNANPAR